MTFFFFLENTLILGENREIGDEIEVKTFFFLENTLILGEK